MKSQKMNDSILNIDEMGTDKQDLEKRFEVLENSINDIIDKSDVSEPVKRSIVKHFSWLRSKCRECKDPTIADMLNNQMDDLLEYVDSVSSEHEHSAKLAEINKNNSRHEDRSKENSPSQSEDNRQDAKTGECKLKAPTTENKSSVEQSSDTGQSENETEDNTKQENPQENRLHAPRSESRDEESEEDARKREKALLVEQERSLEQYRDHYDRPHHNYGRDQLLKLQPDDKADVILNVPNVSVDLIEFQVNNVSARLALDAGVGEDMARLFVGVDVKIERVKLTIENVQATAQLIVRLDNVRKIVERALEVIDSNEHPSLLGMTQRLTGTDK